MKYLLPNIYKKNIFEINYNELKNKNIKLIAFDLDNTIIANNNNVLNENIISLFNDLKHSFIVVILSNTRNKKKIEFISKKLGINYIYSAHKPFSKGFKKINKNYNANYQNICMIGDQLLTDIAGANKLGILSILVDPLSNNEWIFTKINRLIENIKMKKLYKLYNFKRGNYYD